MKRWLLIGLAAIAVIAGLGGAGLYFFAPQFLFAEKQKSEDGAHPSKKPEPESLARERDTHVDKMMRDLAAVQDRAAYGDREAISEQRGLLVELGTRFRNFEEIDWSQYPNFRTALVYVLSGGEPDVLERALDNPTIGDADRNLGRGVRSFALGQTKAARIAFADIDPRSLDLALVGPFSMARASLYMEKDAANAVRLLDDARLSSPHTAIEEAAVRREIPLLVSIGQMARAKVLVTDYVRRFGKSIYASKLFRDFAGAVAKGDLADDDTLVAELSEGIQTSDPQIAGAFFVDLAGEALPRGLLRLAKAAAEAVLKPVGAASEDVARAKLYIAAADAPSARSLDALASLRQVKNEELSDEDTGIKEVAGFVARVVTGDELLKLQPGGAAAAAQPQVSSALEGADGAIEKAASLISENDK